MNVIAVDVGTTSVRLALVSFNLGQVQVLASHKQDIGHTQIGNRFEQSSKQIWQAICNCCRECLRKTKIRSDSIQAIAFSATCSLVIEEPQNSETDIIMWMDHRAIREAQAITKSRHKVLEQFGGVCSPEFSLAKLVWLKNNQPERFARASAFFELPDWLVHRCVSGPSDQAARSLCCVTCKWGYDVDLGKHCDFVSSLDASNIGKFGSKVLKPGQKAGSLSLGAAKDLGLLPDDFDLSDKENQRLPKIAVGSSLVDAHSGALAMLTLPLDEHNINLKIESTYCSLAGTSSCIMLQSKERNFTSGVWGPYKDVVIDNFYLLEAGQSMSGKLIEICIESSVEGRRLLESGQSLYEIIGNLNKDIIGLDRQLTGNSLHILPTYHGNRSPLANPRLRGGVYGLSAEGPTSLLESYAATVESIVYEVKYITESLGRSGANLSTILVSGGLMKNSFYMQTLADVLQCQVVKVCLGQIDFMVMGSAILARQAASQDRPIDEDTIGRKLCYAQLDIKKYEPTPSRSIYHNKKYNCYKEFVELSRRIDQIINQ